MAATRKNLTGSGEGGATVEQGLREVVASLSPEVFKMHPDSKQSDLSII